jgi:hypothetical protein
MTRKWKNLSLVALLSMLQCIAPLVHAHVSSDSHSDSIHFHLNGDILDHDEDATAKPELSNPKVDLSTVSVAQGFKNDYILFSTANYGTSHTKLSASLLNAPPLVNIGQTKLTSFRFLYCHPPAQAPPVS